MEGLVQIFSFSKTGLIGDDPYWTSTENSFEMIELSSIKTPNNKLEHILIFYFGHCQVCTECEAERTYVRTFDVTEKTALRRHNTGRLCHICGSKLRDTIVHFGEKGCLEWPLNWQGAIDAGKATDCIVCLGSSLKVRTMGTRFKCCMHI